MITIIKCERNDVLQYHSTCTLHSKYTIAELVHYRPFVQNTFYRHFTGNPSPLRWNCLTHTVRQSLLGIGR